MARGLLDRPLGQVLASPAAARAALLFCAGVLYLGELGDAGLSANDTALHAGLARRMVQTGRWGTPELYGAPWYEHLPPFLWVTAASFHALGFSPFAARLPHVLLALVAIWAVYEIGRLRAGTAGGLIAGLALATTEMFWRYAARVRPDVPMVAAIALALLGLELARDGRARGLLLWGLGSGAAVFCKGPMAAVCFVALGVALVVDRRAGAPPWWRSRWLALGLLLAAALPVPWISYQAATYGSAWFDRYVGHQILWLPLHDQSAAKDYWVVPRVLLRLYWPWVLLLGLALLRLARGGRAAARPLVVILAWAGFITLVLTFSRRQTEYYLLPAFPAFALLAGWSVADRLSGEVAQARLTLAVAGLGLALALVLVVTPLSLRRGSLERETERLERLLPALEAPLAQGTGLGIFALHKDRTIWSLNLYLDLPREPEVYPTAPAAAAGLRRGTLLLLDEAAQGEVTHALGGDLRVLGRSPPLLLARASTVAAPSSAPRR